jgi:hypothetical protein
MLISSTNIFLEVIEIRSIFQNITLNKFPLVDIVIIDLIELNVARRLLGISHIDTQRNLLFDTKSTVIVQHISGPIHDKRS